MFTAHRSLILATLATLALAALTLGGCVSHHHDYGWDHDRGHHHRHPGGHHHHGGGHHGGHRGHHGHHR